MVKDDGQKNGFRITRDKKSHTYLIKSVLFSNCSPELTFLNVLVLVEGLNGVVLGQPPEGVDQVGAQVRVNVLRGELGRAYIKERRIKRNDISARSAYRMVQLNSDIIETGRQTDQFSNFSMGKKIPFFIYPSGFTYVIAWYVHTVFLGDKFVAQ